MSRTPAAELARVKVAHPRWSIRRVTSGEGFTAINRETRERVHARTLADLEHRLADRPHINPQGARQ
jgi:hypothetical protein